MCIRDRFQAEGGWLRRYDLSAPAQPLLREILNLREPQGGLEWSIETLRFDAEGNRLGVLTRSPDGRGKAWLLEFGRGSSYVVCLTEPVPMRPVALDFDQALLVAAFRGEPASSHGRVVLYRIVPDRVIGPVWQEDLGFEPRDVRLVGARAVLTGAPAGPRTLALPVGSREPPPPKKGGGARSIP